MINEDEKLDIVLEKCASDKMEYEETITRMAEEDYQRWLSLIRPEYMEKYLDGLITNYIKRNISIKMSVFEFGEVAIEVYVKDKPVITESTNIIESIKGLIDVVDQK